MSDKNKKGIEPAEKPKKKKVCVWDGHSQNSPLCGGGYGGEYGAIAMRIEDANCERCLALLKPAEKPCKDEVISLLEKANICLVIPGTVIIEAEIYHQILTLLNTECNTERLEYLHQTEQLEATLKAAYAEIKDLRDVAIDQEEKIIDCEIITKRLEAAEAAIQTAQTHACPLCKDYLSEAERALRGEGI